MPLNFIYLFIFVPQDAGTAGSGGSHTDIRVEKYSDRRVSGRAVRASCGHRAAFTIVFVPVGIFVSDNSVTRV
jgi:hypothetical protein